MPIFANYRFRNSIITPFFCISIIIVLCSVLDKTLYEKYLHLGEGGGWLALTDVGCDSSCVTIERPNQAIHMF